MNKKERMIELIKRVCGKRIDKVYGNKPLFYLFLKTCAMNVVFKTKWNANSTIKNYYEYVTVQDEAFAFLVLENNGNRYLDMLNTKKKKKICVLLSIQLLMELIKVVERDGLQMEKLDTQSWLRKLKNGGIQRHQK